jgi:hypothetical protein
MQNIAAFTAPTPPQGYADYISINVRDDGKITVTVREDRIVAVAKGEGMTIALSPEQWADIKRQITESVHG